MRSKQPTGARMAITKMANTYRRTDKKISYLTQMIGKFDIGQKTPKQLLEEISKGKKGSRPWEIKGMKILEGERLKLARERGRSKRYAIKKAAEAVLHDVLESSGTKKEGVKAITKLMGETRNPLARRIFEEARVKLVKEIGRSQEKITRKEIWAESNLAHRDKLQFIKSSSQKYADSAKNHYEEALVLALDSSNIDLVKKIRKDLFEFMEMQKKLGH